MKKLKFFMLMMLSAIILSSCSSGKKDDELSSLLVMGPYAVLAKGPKMSADISTYIPAGETDPEKLKEPYKKIFSTPHSPVYAAQYKPILLDEHKVTDKNSAEKRINELISEGDKSAKYKAFKYAVAANVASMAYASGYIAKEDLAAANKKILAAVREHYSDWETYLNDVVEGRKVSPTVKDPSTNVLFDGVKKALLEDPISPYKLYDL